MTESEFQICDPHILGVFVHELVVWETSICTLLVENVVQRISCTFMLKYSKLQGYYKRNRHFRRYVVSKPLA